MTTSPLPIAALKVNPNNPGVIKDAKFKLLCESLRKFPEMLEIRPIVVTPDGLVLGGNMRLQAAKAIGLTVVPVTTVDLTEEQQREFIIKDNASFGEWNFDVLANEWDFEELEQWGLDLPDQGGEDEIEVKGSKEQQPQITITFGSFEEIEVATTKIRELLERDFPDAYLETF
jgi:ParB-like chromosome segregation protein Spo0J